MTVPLYQDIVAKLKSLTRRVERLEAVETTSAGWVILPQASRLTSSAWDGDARSTTGSTLIDMSAVFGTPENIDAVLLRVSCRDSGSAAAPGWKRAWIRFDNVAPGDDSVVVRAADMDDRWADQYPVVATNADGDIYFDCQAKDTDTLRVDIVVLGYHLR